MEEFSAKMGLTQREREADWCQLRHTEAWNGQIALTLEFEIPEVRIGRDEPDPDWKRSRETQLRKTIKDLKSVLDLAPGGIEIGEERLTYLTTIRGLKGVRTSYTRRLGAGPSKEDLTELKIKEGTFLGYPGRYKKSWPAEPDPKAGKAKLTSATIDSSYR